MTFGRWGVRSVVGFQFVDIIFGFVEVGHRDDNDAAIEVVTRGPVGRPT